MTTIAKSNRLAFPRMTVDSFQGQETDLAIFSCVRSNLMKELGFLRDARRLNVAITRAKRGLIVVGDPKPLRTCKHWSALYKSCTDRGCVISATDYHLRKDSDQDYDEEDGSESKSQIERALSLDLDMDDELYGLFS